MARLKIGDPAPDFSLYNQSGKAVSLSDFSGRNVLVWFFPRAFGGG